MKPADISLHVYCDFDCTLVLKDTSYSLLAHEMGREELERLKRLPEMEAGQISLRKAEDMKWEHIRLTIQEAADIVVDPSADMSATRPLSTTATTRIPFDRDTTGPLYYVQLDPGFKAFHQYCQEHNIPVTIVSIGIQPLIEEMLDRYLGVNHGITVRANGLSIREDGSWKIIWRDSSPHGVEKGRALREARANDLKNPNTDHILWCGEASSDFAAALLADVVLARQNTSLEKLCRANLIPHRVFSTFDTVRDAVAEWIEEHPSIDDANEP